MNIFQKIYGLLTGASAIPQLDELDLICNLPNDVINEWLATLSEADKQLILTTTREIHEAGRDHKWFLAIVHHLHQTRSEPITILNGIARKKVAPLLARFEGITENEWTEEELNQWLDSLDDFWRNAMYERVRSYTNRGGTDLIKLLCGLRRINDAREQREAQEAKQNRFSFLHLWYIWQEEGRKIEQHEAAKELRQHLREMRNK